MSTGIEWTEETWNPVVGCSKVSAGCRNCYAIPVSHKLAGNPNPKISSVYEELTTDHLLKPEWTGMVRCLPERLEIPLRWRKPRRVFVNSMSDLFHPDVPVWFIAEVFNVMASGLLTCRKGTHVMHEHDDGCWEPNPHTFQILTKRPERMLEVLRQGGELEHNVAEYWPGDSPVSLAMEEGDSFKTWPLPNVWLGVSVEDQATADERIPLLLQAPAAVRFVSYEPALGEVDFSAWLKDGVSGPDDLDPAKTNRAAHNVRHGVPRLDWVICGGESGPGARPMPPDWARKVRDQCVAADVPFFFKQWGEWGPQEAWPEKFVVSFRNLDAVHNFDDGECVFRFGKKAAGAMIDGHEWKQFPGEAVEGQELKVESGAV